MWNKPDSPFKPISFNVGFLCLLEIVNFLPFLFHVLSHPKLLWRLDDTNTLILHYKITHIRTLTHRSNSPRTQSSEIILNWSCKSWIGKCQHQGYKQFSFFAIVRTQFLRVILSYNELSTRFLTIHTNLNLLCSHPVNIRVAGPQL